MTAPVARATVRGADRFRLNATRSNATVGGCVRAIASRTARPDASRRSRLFLVRRRADRLGPPEHGTALLGGDHREAEPGHAGVNAEHQVSNIRSHPRCGLEARQSPTASERRHDLFGDVEVRVDVLDVVELLEGLDQVEDLLGLAAVDRDRASAAASRSRRETPATPAPSRASCTSLNVLGIA